MQDIATRVKKIIVDKLGVDEAEVTPEASFTNDLGADSLDTVELIMLVRITTAAFLVTSEVLSTLPKPTSPLTIAMYLAKELTQKSLPEIGELFGGRDHTTVLHAVRKMAAERQQMTELNQQLHVLEQTLKG